MTSRSAAFVRVLSASAILACAGSAMADFNYAFFSFFGQPEEILLAGDATFSDTIHLTTDEDQAGAMWYRDRQPVANGFVTTFQFRIEAGPTIQLPGDGFAFVLSNSSDGNAALGEGGSGLGYAGIAQSVAVEFDTFGFEGEFGVPHVAIHSRGSGVNDADDSSALAHADLAAMGIDILDGSDHTANVQYVPADGESTSRIDVYVDGRLVLTTPISLTGFGADPGNGVAGEDLTNEGQMYVGFTAGTGLADSVHVIPSWAFDADTGQCGAPYWHLLSWGSGGPGSTGIVDAQINGTQPMTYSWYRNDGLIVDDDGGRITGLSSNRLSINDIQLADGGYYRCTATNACGTVEVPAVPLSPCRVDVNFDGDINPDDLADFIGRFFSMPPDGADFNGDGAVDPDDLADFIGAYFGGGC